MSRQIKGTITTEHPQEHWGFLNVQGKTVLDLGCGINSEHTPTPWYFLEDKKNSLRLRMWNQFRTHTNPLAFLGR